MTTTELILKLKDASGIDPFESSRERRVVEIRSLLVYLLREKMNMRWIAIKRCFEVNGRITNNSTLIHSLTAYKIYAKSNKKLKDILSQFAFKSEHIDEIRKIQILENRCRILERKLRNCEGKDKSNIKNLTQAR